MPPRIKRLLAATAVIALAIPVLAQDRPASILPPGFGDPAPPPPAPKTPAPAAPSIPGAEPTATEPLAPLPGVDEGQVAETDSLSPADAAVADMVEPIEVPDRARRDPTLVGRLDPAAIGLERNPWGSASGRFLERAMRRTDGALPSRWLHIALRNVLLARAESPYGIDGADWAAERAWLLLRMGEADAARMLVAGVDVADFTPKLQQVAVQSALASADPAGLCPIRDGLSKVEPRIAPLVDAICSSLAGNPETAAADIDDARRRGRIGGIDVSLADKLVGAGQDTKRAVTIEWDPVPKLTAWRFGLASATGLAIPERLFANTPPQFRAWSARAPMLAVDQRLPAARLAAGLGVFSGQSLVDVYSAQYDRTDPDELTKSEAWQLRLAFVGKGQAARLSAMRKLWAKADKDPIEREATRAMLAIAASQVRPDAALAEDAPNLIASMLAAGMDQAAARWVPALADMDDKSQDACWAMLALGAPTTRGLDLSYKRIDQFIGRDLSEGNRRGALLVAGLVALDRIDGPTAGKLSGRYGFGLDRRNEWTNLIDGAAKRGQGGTATVLAGLAFHGERWSNIPALFLFHAAAALHTTGQDFNARMIAAEALSRS